MLATLLQVLRKTFWRLRESRKSLEKLFGVCGSPASASENFLAFAGVPQVPRKTFWRLREPRKSLEKLFGVCGSPASLAAFALAFADTPASLTGNALAFAGVPQVPREMLWCLRESRKCLGKLFGVCGSPASASENFLAFAGAPQVPREMLWCLQHRCKHFQKRFGHGVASRNSPQALFLRRTPRCVDEQKAREGAVLMRSPSQRPLPRRGEIKTASIFAAAKRKNDGSVAQLDRATAF